MIFMPQFPLSDSLSSFSFVENMLEWLLCEWMNLIRDVQSKDSWCKAKDGKEHIVPIFSIQVSLKSQIPLYQHAEEISSARGK